MMRRVIGGSRPQFWDAVSATDSVYRVPTVAVTAAYQTRSAYDLPTMKALGDSVDHLGKLRDRRTTINRGRTAAKGKKRFNFLTKERFIQKTQSELSREVIATREGSVHSIFSIINNFNTLNHMKFKQWFERERIENTKYIPRDLAARLCYHPRISFTTPGLVGFENDSKLFLRGIRRMAPALPFDLHLQCRHGLLTNFASSAEGQEWRKKLDIENVDLTKAVFRDRPLSDIMSFYINGCYGNSYSNKLAEVVFNGYREGTLPIQAIIDELLTPKVGQRLVNFKLSESQLPLSHQAITAAVILFRNHPLMPQANTIVGSAKKRYDSLVAKRNRSSYTRVAKGKGEDGSDVTNVLDPDYKVSTDMCGVIDFLDSCAYLASMSRLVNYRNAQTSSALLLRPRWRDGIVNNMRPQYCPQMEFICRIVNTMSASEQSQMVDYVDRYQARICRELEREMVAVSALTAYLTHHHEYRYLSRPVNSYQELFDAATMMHTCTTSRYLPRYIFMHLSTAHRDKYGIFFPHLGLPHNGAGLWTHTYRRESFARGVKFTQARKFLPDKPFEYGDGAPNPSNADFSRLTVLQRAALDFCFPQRLSMGEAGKSYSNPFNNYGSQRIKELKAQTGLALPFPAMMAIIAREWFMLPQEVKNQFDVRVLTAKTDSLSFPLSGAKPSAKVDVKNLPSEPIAAPLPPVSKKLAIRPHVVNMGRYRPADPKFHKDPLVRLGFVNLVSDTSIDFFGNKALAILHKYLGANNIVKDPSEPSIANGDLGDLQKPLIPLKKLPQQHLPEVVLAELARCGLYDQKQPVAFDLEMSKEAVDFRVKKLRCENPLRSAIVSSYSRVLTVGKHLRLRNKLKEALARIGQTDLVEKMDAPMVNGVHAVEGGSRHRR